MISDARPQQPWRGATAAVTVLAPRSGAGLDAFLDATLRHGGTPFDPERAEWLGKLSAAFLRDPVLRADPASVAVAYWMRPAQTARLTEEFRRLEALDPTVVRVPVGRVFHVAPSNVDTLFVYSWALSFLCGNANVVRVSSEHGPMVRAMLEVIDAIATDCDFVRDENRFVTYAHDETVTAALSHWCAHRVIWGGNDTVAAVRPIALNPHASERVFGSKLSHAVISARRYLADDREARARLASAFFNDLFWFDQMACSSPQVLFWVGSSAEAESAARAFEDELQREVERRDYHPTVSNAVHRRSYAFDLAADADVRVGFGHAGFVGVELRDPASLTKDACGGGLIRHLRIERLADVERTVDEGDQTLTQYGFAPDELIALARSAGARGIDRIVPIGQALAFEPIWDGYDLLQDFVRLVRVKTS